MNSNDSMNSDDSSGATNGMADKLHFSSIDHLQFHLKWGYEWKMPPEWRLERVNRYPFFWLVTEGTMDVIYDDRAYRLEPGSLLCAEAYLPLQAQSTSERPIGFLSIGYEADVLGTPLASWLQLPVHHALADSASLLPVWRRLIRRFDYQLSLEQGSAEVLEQLEVLSLQYAWLHQLLRRLPMQPATASSLNDPRVDKACRHIEAHLHEELSTASIAASVHLSPNYLRTLFQRDLRLSPIDYVRHRRLRRAQELLLSGSAPISDIGEQAGYTDPAEFSRLFRKHFRLSPKQYRQKWKSSDLGC
ncbi:AraC family transcriptional regulator [Cohnella fermenti]|uniref:Helix-turn-helix transcriptional regulator n=1 Tax=Cohnella fermenti TaxID=2565925 RepID=A0A4S4BIT2_9BACL|nr:AraC family transcriptional regulator [Cohnella fermenti]THF74306.1 helix-turn-helix transcriptional regulator [Cohnella fermenti]